MAKPSILVIDDELVMCEFLSNLLKEKGYTVKYALSGTEGLKAFKEGKFDVVMADSKMPDVDRIQLLEKIKAEYPKSIFVIYPSFETTQAALGKRGYDYVTQPFNLEEISFVLKRSLAFQELSLNNKRLMRELENQNTRLEEKVKERTRELTLLYGIGRDISASLKLDTVLDIIVDRLSEVLNLEMCSILLIDKNTGHLVIKSARGLDMEIVENTRIARGESISGWVVEHKEPLLVVDIEKDPRFTRANREKYYTHSFISVPLVIKGEIIGVINVNNKRSKQPFTQDDFKFVKAVANEAAIAVENARLYTFLEDTYIRTVMALTSAIDARDHYTRRHSEHVTKYAVAIATEMGLSEDEIREIRQACQLHDLGKIGVHDYILNKPDKLTPEEWEEIKSHPLKSVEILKPLAFLGDVIKLVEQHHERYDGMGYPFGVKGEKIILGARIMSVADSFDAIITERPYRKPFSKQEAVEELTLCSGTQFDPKVVQVFLKVLKNNPEIIKD